MLVLGLESATPVASAALADERGLLGEVLLNVGLTHSEQLLPMIDDLLRQCRRTIGDVTAVGVSAGPGSFTGLRIGMATAKALAQGLSVDRKVRLLAVPTLEAMAWQMMGQTQAVSPMLNARREQVYAGLYRWRREDDAPTAGQAVQELPLGEIFAARQRGKKERLPAGAGEGWSLDCLIPPEAVGPEAWAERLGGLEQPLCLLGDGAAMYEEIWRRELGEGLAILPPYLGLSRGSFIALAAWKELEKEGTQDGRDDFSMKPLYLRGI